MEGILRLMSEAARKLEIDFDTGDETQALQQGIVSGLDEAIKIAASNRRPKRGSNQSSHGDKRRMPTGRPPTERQTGRGDEQGRDPSSSEATEAGQAASQNAMSRGDLRESRKAWGHLPARERDEIIQGIGERYLERYRAWIERYYRALQEAEE